MVDYGEDQRGSSYHTQNVPSVPQLNTQKNFWLMPLRLERLAVSEIKLRLAKAEASITS